MGKRLESSERVGVGDDAAVRSLNSRAARGVGKLGEVVVGGESVGRVKVLVDDAGHALLAVVPLGLGAVEPDGLLVLDGDLEDVLTLTLGDVEVEAGEEPDLGVSGVGQGLAGLAEGRLGDGVVQGGKVPFDHITNLGNDVVGFECQRTASCSDCVGDACQRDGVGRGPGVYSAGWCSKSRGNEESSGKGLGEHLDDYFILLGNTQEDIGNKEMMKKK